MRNNKAVTPTALALATFLGFFLATCQKIEPERKIIVKTTSYSDVTTRSAKLTGTLFDLGENGVSEHGFYLSLTPDITDAFDPIKLGESKKRGEFQVTAVDLMPGTTYYAWAFASEGNEMDKGVHVAFITLSAVLPQVESGGITDLTPVSAKLGCKVLADGGDPVTERGVCWDISPAPTKDKAHSLHGSGTGEYVGVITGLSPGVTYYARAFAYNSAGASYGADREFTTPLELVPPEISTHSVTEISWNSAVSGGTISSDGNGEIVEKGICWSPETNPDVSDFKIISFGPDQSFTLTMPDLEPGKEYFVRAFARNSAGTGYGNDVVFWTLESPVVPIIVTFEITGIEYNSALSGGSITSDGGAPILSKGLCWSATVSEPTLANDFIEYGNGSGPFNMEISGLKHNTQYFVRAFARNEIGTGYGEPVTFRTLFMCGSQLVDVRDGETYFTVQIGEQCWMAENLNVGEIIGISSGQSNNSVIEKYCYADNDANCEIFGGQYTWDEMMQYTLIESAQGVCPAGWHIPSDFEWKIMERSLGMSVAESDGTEWRGSDQGGHLKAEGIYFWNPPNQGATNSSLFTALPSGMVFSNGNSTGIGDFAVFWTSTPILETQAWYRYLHTDESRIYRVDGFRPNTTSVRCIKD